VGELGLWTKGRSLSPLVGRVPGGELHIGSGLRGLVADETLPEASPPAANRHRSAARSALERQQAWEVSHRRMGSRGAD